VNKILNISILYFILSVFGHPPLNAGVRYQLDFSSSYIWRGFDLNPSKKPVLQLSVDLDLGQSGFAVNLWSSFSFVSSKLNEFDLTLSYSTDLTKDISIEAGLIHYAWYFTDNFKFKDDTSHEVFFSFGIPNLFFEPALSIYYDFTVGDGLYIQFDIGHSFPILKSLELALSSSLGYNGGQWLANESDSGFSDLNFGLALPFTTGRFQALAFANYTIVLLETIGQENHFWLGFSVSYKKTGFVE
jgi:uncharacterized protein (TIGR02001 family)